MNSRHLLYSMVVAGLALCLLLGCRESGEERAQAAGAVLRVGGVSIDGHLPVVSRTGSLLNKGEIGISRASGKPIVDNRKYTYGNPWTTTDGILLENSDSELAAYYPYSETLYEGTGATATLHMTPGIYSEANELCAGIFTASVANSSQTLTLTHVYSRISIRFIKQFTYTGAGQISSLTIGEQYLAASYGLFSGNYTKTSPQTDLVLPLNLSAGTDNADNADNATADVLLIPLDKSEFPASGIPFSFVVDKTEGGAANSGKYEGILPADLFAKTGGELRAANHYRLKVLLGSDGYTIASDDIPVIGDWNIGAIIDGGEIRPIN